MKKDANNGPSIGLALGGGVARGLAHVGVLQAMEDNQLFPNCISGTSAGAFVVAMYAFGMPVSEIYERAAKLRWPNLSSPAVSSLGLASNQAIGKIINEVVGRVNIEESIIPLLIVATDIETGEEVVIKKGDLGEAVMASTCLPGIFKPVSRGGRLLVDGGLVDNVPVEPLKKNGIDVVVAVNVSPHGKYRKPVHVIDVMLNVYDIATDTATANKLQMADVVIAPNVASYSRTNLKQLPALYKEGYEATVAAIPKIKEAMRIKTLGRLSKLGRCLGLKS